MPAPGVTWYPKGSASALDVDAVARAFGFQSAVHLDAVLKGNAPSALQDNASRTHRAKRAA